MFATKPNAHAAHAVPSGKASPVPSPAKTSPTKSLACSWPFYDRDTDGFLLFRTDELKVHTSEESLAAGKLTRNVSSSSEAESTISTISSAKTAVEETSHSTSSSTFNLKETFVRRR